MNKKIILLLVGIVILAGCLVVLNFWKNSTKNPQANTEASSKTTQETEIVDKPVFTFDTTTVKPEDQKVAVHTPSGSEVRVNNFLKNSQPFDTNGDLALTPLSDVYTLADYEITFYPQGEVFRININKEPMEATRKTAENRLLEILGVSPQEACKLNVYVGVSKDIDEKYAGVNLGLSFCQ